MNVIGSIFDSEPYCIDCMDPTNHVIFDSDELEYPLICNERHDVIITLLSPEGKRYVKNLIRKAYYTKSNISLPEGFTETYSDIYHEILEENNENNSST